LQDPCRNGGVDVCIGSRYIKGGSVTNWPWTRRMLSYSASLYVRALLRLPLKDPTAGFVCYKREVLQAIPFQQIQFAGYAFQIDMKHLCWKRKFVIQEIPITFTERTQGKSKMSQTILREAIVGVWRLRNANPPSNDL
jgi:dolichol-phosphate mannosyltransferase